MRFSKLSFFLVLVFLASLVGCKGVSDDDSASSSTPASSQGNNSVPPVGAGLIIDWDEETKDLMREVIDEVLPVAPVTEEYGVEEYEDEDGLNFYIDDSGIAANVLTTYGNKLNVAGFTYVEGWEGTDEDYGDFEEVLYAKEKGDLSAAIQLGYYVEDGYFYIMGWMGDIEIGGDITFDGEYVEILPTTLAELAGTSYALTNGDHNIDGLTFTTNQVQHQSDTDSAKTSFIQFQKNTSSLYNKQAWPAIDQIIVTYLPGNAGVLTLTAGTSSTSLSAKTSTTGTYDLGGATFFKMEGITQALKLTSIMIVFVAD